MRSYRLLTVDDDAVDLKLYRASLARLGPDTCHIQQAMNGAAGLAALHANVFDCVLLDHHLPDMTGLEFLSAALVDGQLPCAVVLVTGHGNEAIAVEAMKRGAQDYMVKDKVNAASLWRAITQAVTQAELRRRLAVSLRELTAANLRLEHKEVIRKAAESASRSAREAAEGANAAKTRFIAMVTHELRTPLNGILGYTQLLRIEGGLSARQDAHVGAMMQAGRHLFEMIERVLDFASIETGEMTLHPVWVAIGDLTAECNAFVGPMATERGLRLGMFAGHDAPRQIVTDPARLRQVLLNLLGNAVKYTDTGSVELRMLTGAAPGSLRIEVVDTGPGVKAAARGRLFQDFERLDAAEGVEGAGLGLAIAARIIKLMGGTIDHAANPNGGSVFWFELPASELPLGSPDTEMAGTAWVAPVKNSPELSSLRVLVVDDIAMNRDVVAAFLTSAGHAVSLAMSGDEAIRLASSEAVDLILMDVRMPGMDGLEVTRRIRTLPGLKGKVPILALTANTFPDQVAQCLEAGMNGHVAKPVEYATLISAISNTMARVPPSRMCDRSVPPTGALASLAPAPPVFDRAVLDHLATFLPPDEIRINLQLLRGHQDDMLRLLEGEASDELLTEVAHQLMSAAGMFGFAALSQVARNFERAVSHDESRIEKLAQQLRGEIREALPVLDRVVNDDRRLPA